MRMPFAETVEADELERILRLAAAVAFGGAAQRQWEFDILFHAAPGQQRKVLEHKRQRVTAVRRLYAAQLGRARARLQQPAQNR